MDRGVLLALAPVVALLINIVVQVAAFRYGLIKSLLKSVYAGFAAGLASMSLLQIFARVPLAEMVFVAAANVLTYGALGYCYFAFINLGVTARRIRILMEFSEAGGALSMESLLARYNAKEMIQNRLARLMGSRQVLYEDGRYFIGKPVMLLIAKLIMAMKVAIIGKRSEFEK